MPNNDPWADIPAGDFYVWENPGEVLTGDVIAKIIDKDFNGGPCPGLTIRLDDGEEIRLTAGQAQLKAKLLEAKPQVGDRIRIAFTGIEKRSGGKTLKQFEVSIKSGGAKSKVEQPTQQTTAAAAPADDDDF